MWNIISEIGEVYMNYENPCQLSCLMNRNASRSWFFLIEYSARLWYGWCSLKGIWIWLSLRSLSCAFLISPFPNTTFLFLDFSLLSFYCVTKMYQIHQTWRITAVVTQKSRKRKAVLGKGASSFATSKWNI